MQGGLLSFLMGLKCLPEMRKRITLWRNTIRLFYTYKDVAGPFFTAGITQLRVETPVQERSFGMDYTPDIIAAGPDGWVVVDVTYNDKSKTGTLDNYEKIDPRCLSTFGFPSFTTPPDTISSRFSFNDDGNHCQIVVKDKFDVKKEEFLQNSKLRDAFVAMKGQDMTSIASMAITLLPEMKNGEEIREGIVDIAAQLFGPHADGKTSYEICEIGLERLFTLVPAISKKSLVMKIDNEMKSLVNYYLKGYLEYSDGKYRAVEKYKNPKAQTRKFIDSKLKEWVRSPQKTLSDTRYYS